MVRKSCYAMIRIIIGFILGIMIAKLLIIISQKLYKKEINSLNFDN